MSFIQFVFSNLITTGALLAVGGFIFKAAFTKVLDKEMEKFKGGLAKDLEVFKGDLAKDLESFKYDLRLEENAHQLKLQTQLDIKGRQLQEFYWPLYLGLQKDNVVWSNILHKRDPNNELLKKLGATVEKETILPNHNRLVSIIEEKLHLAQANDELMDALLRYIKHVSVYNALNQANNQMLPEEIGEVWPQDLFPMIEKRLRQLQKEYNDLLEIQQRPVVTS